MKRKKGYFGLFVQPNLLWKTIAYLRPGDEKYGVCLQGVFISWATDI